MSDTVSIKMDDDCPTGHNCLFSEKLFELSDEITRLRAENERLRAALANSELPCVYCTLPKEEWGKCEMGFPGCGRADDAMGCPELGARMEADALRADLAAVTAERDNLQILHDEAYIAGMKHGWNCCAAGDEERYKNSIENTRGNIRRARATLKGE